MNRLLGPIAAVAGVLVPSAALGCGGFFASEIEVDPSQNIIVAHRGGIETYVFRPHFCGAAKDFGVILPIPSPLASSPMLAEASLFDFLDSYTAPEVEEVCESPAIGCGAAMKDEAVGASRGIPDVDVVDRGRVGQFEYVVLKATSTSAFTDWLDQNGFPRDASLDGAFDHYVSNGWHFVAFKVSADSDAPPAGMRLCGDLGPIQLSFPANQPVVPARIAAVNRGSYSMPFWRVFLVTAKQQELSPSISGVRSTLYFSKAMTQQELQATAFAALAQPGERLTVLTLDFYNYEVDDLLFVDAAVERDYRFKKTVYKECLVPGCTASGALTPSLLALLGLFSLRRRRK